MSMTCEIVQEVCKRAGERKAFPAFDWVDVFARRWIAKQPFGNGVAVRPANRPATGLEYVSSGGVTAAREPKWPTTTGGTVMDGSITWTARAITYDSLIYRIDDVEYDVPEGITLHEQDFIDEPAAQQVPLEVSGGTEGETYDIVVRVQCTAAGLSAPLREAVLRVTID